MKKCNICKNIKSIEDFFKDSSKKDNLSYRCKICQKKLKQNTPSDSYEYRKKRNQNPDVKLKNKQRSLEYYYNTKNDPFHKLKRSLRRRINQAFTISNNWIKEGSSEKLLGTTYLEAKLHIESLFKNKMTWDNHGEWHIDHIIPLASAKTKEELIKLCHYTNLQPLWAKDNLIKNKF